MSRWVLADMLKQINQKDDMVAFGTSEAKAKLSSLIEYISSSVTGLPTPLSCGPESGFTARTLVGLFEDLELLLGKIELVGGTQRFGNPAFRVWFENAIDMIKASDGLASLEIPASTMDEAKEYLGLSFGNPQRLDYGTGHELAFLAFFGTVVEGMQPQDMLLVWDRYYRLSRAIIQHYKLEPAGSHGVWGLDDHYHLCYVFGASQLLPAPESKQSTASYPTPQDINVPQIVEEWAPINLYFAAIKFIATVKKGPFHEHSPLLFNASGAASWTKIRNGMTRMYTDNVLDKFPVVQHFVFGDTYKFQSPS